MKKITEWMRTHKLYATTAAVLIMSKGAVLNTRPQKGKQRKKEKGVPNLERGFVLPKLGTPLVM